MQTRCPGCARCRRAHLPQQAVCTYCGASLARPPRRWPWLAVPLLVAVWASRAGLLPPRKGLAEVAVTWETLGPGRAQGRLRNLTSRTLVDFSLCLTTRLYSRWPAGGPVATFAEFPDWPPPLQPVQPATGWDRLPPPPTFSADPSRRRSLAPGAETVFTVSVPFTRQIPFPAGLQVEGEGRTLRFTQRLGSEEETGP